MIKMYVTAAFAVVLSIVIVSFSFAGASCCDPAKAAGIQGVGPAQAGVANPTTPAVPNNPRSQGIAAFMGYGKPEGVRLSDLAPRGSCCNNPNASCATRANAAGQRPTQSLAPTCGGGCCGANTSVQPGQTVGQFGAKPIQAAGPKLTARPVKAVARPKPPASGGLW